MSDKFRASELDLLSAQDRKQINEFGKKVLFSVDKKIRGLAVKATEFFYVIRDDEICFYVAYLFFSGWPRECEHIVEDEFKVVGDLVRVRTRHAVLHSQVIMACASEADFADDCAQHIYDSLISGLNGYNEERSCAEETEEKEASRVQDDNGTAL